MAGSAAPGWTHRAYRYALDPTKVQTAALARSAGAARWAYNHALAAKVAAHQAWRDQVDALVAAGVPEAEARRAVRVPTPTKPAVQKAWGQLRGDSRTGVDGASPWWHEVSTYCFQSAFADADRAWASWLDSLAGRRVGPRVGYPRFKRKHRCRDSFRVHHDVHRPTIRPVTHRRLLIPRLGEIRVHGTLKPLTRALERGEARIQSVTVTRHGHRWWASVLCQIRQPDRPPTRAQRARGTVGVDVGVHHLAALSTGDTVANPRHLRAAASRLVRAQRALSRTRRGSTGRDRARARLGRRHAEVAERRAATLHALTKQLAIGWATVAVEDLHVAGMTRSARGTLQAPGRNVAAKAGLNRAVLDAALGQLRRQLDYKTRWYGSRLVVIDRWAPTSQTCSTCGWRNPSLTLAERVFHCQVCGQRADRDVNAAANIAALAADPAAWQAAVAPGAGETLNARGGSVRPATPVAGSTRRSGKARRPSRGAGPPRPSNRPALPTRA